MVMMEQVVSNMDFVFLVLIISVQVIARFYYELFVRCKFLLLIVLNESAHIHIARRVRIVALPTINSLVALLSFHCIATTGAGVVLVRSLLNKLEI